MTIHRQPTWWTHILCFFGWHWRGVDWPDSSIDGPFTHESSRCSYCGRTGVFIVNEESRF